MVALRKATFLNSEKLGAIIVIASMLVIFSIVFTLIRHQYQERLTEVKTQGINLIRVLSGMSYTDLVPGAGHDGMLKMLYQSHNVAEFAYGAVFDADGQMQSEVAAPGVILPEIVMPKNVTTRLQERTFVLANGKDNIVEFAAPILHNGIEGYVYLGYFEPKNIFSNQIPFIATLALPIFLLAPFIYFLLRRELKPLKEINQKLDDYSRVERIDQIDINSTLDVSSLMPGFTAFLEKLHGEIKQLEGTQENLLTSTKVLTYKQNRLESILGSFPTGLIVLDESGNVSFANDKFCDLLAIGKDEILAKQPKEWCQNQVLKDYLAKYEGSLSSGYLARTVEFKLENLPEKLFVASAYPLFSLGTDQDVFGTLVELRDVTAESITKTSQSDFVAHVAHELKTPLNVLSMYSEALQSPDSSKKEFRVEACNVIADEVERMSTLINNLLSLTKIEMGELSIQKDRVKLHDLLKDAFESVSRSAFAKDLKLDLKLPKELSTVYVDKDLLRVAINNLLTNAIKYNKPKGSVTLSAEEDDGEVDILVKDTGIGISEEDQEQIFEKFYRSNEQDVRDQTGHGLGLALAKNIIELHNGELGLSSTPGEGTEFSVKLAIDTDQLMKEV